MAYPVYIFDLYGTLVDILTDESPGPLWEREAALYTSFGAAYGADELRREYLRLCAKEQAGEADPLYEIELRRVFEGLFLRKGREPGEKLTAFAAERFREYSTLRLGIYPWVGPVFRRIREAGSRIFLLSNAQACFTVPEFEKLGLARAFDAIRLSSDVGRRKPHPAIMQALLEGAGADPAQCMMIGNDKSSDIAIAKAFGMRSLYIKTETSEEIEGAPEADAELTDGDWSKLPALLGL